VENCRFLHKKLKFKFICSLFYGRTKKREAPEHLLWSYIFKQVETFNAIFGKPLEPINTSKRARGKYVVGAKQWRKISILLDLPYWETNLLRHCLNCRTWKL